MSGSPYIGPVRDLIDPYRSTHFNQEVDDFDSLGRAKAWLHAHPGRWGALRTGVVSGGKYPGLEVRQRLVDGTTYVFARVRHPEGESLDEALARTGPFVMGVPPKDLPKLERDKFGWTPEELADAVWLARENLFPVGELGNGGGNADDSTYDTARAVAVG